MATRKRATKKQSARGKASKKKSSKAKSTRAKSTKAKSTRKKSTRKAAAKRTLIAPRGDKRYVRRSNSGRFKESDDVGKALSTDRRKRAKRKAKSGQGDKGD